ncbi:trypco2 family protein [Nocardia sp. NPDC055321]
MEIELGDAVAALRDELMRAAARRGESDVAFAVGPIEMSFDVELRQDAKVKAGFKAWVVSGDVEGGAGRTRRQRVSLTLTPQAPGGGDVLIGREPDSDEADGVPERIEP